MTDDQMREALAEALVAALPGDVYLRAYDRVDALLPVVRDIVADAWRDGYNVATAMLMARVTFTPDEAERQQ